MIILNVAEKPKAAKKIAHILAGQPHNCQFRTGYSKINPVYEFDYLLDGRTKCKMVVTSVLGHLYQFDFGKAYGQWQTIDPVILMKSETPIERFVPDKMKGIEKTLIRESKKADFLYLWLDGDREGENIAFEVIQTCQTANATLRGPKLKRARFSDFSPSAILRAIKTMEAPNEKMSESVDARREIDLRIGAAFTRFQTLQLKNKYKKLKGLNSISYGPCQFPTLGFVVRRYIKRKNFVQEAFWSIQVEHTKDTRLTKFLWERGNLFNQKVVEMYFGLVSEIAIAKVIDVSGKPTTRYKPKPMNTVDLQKLASKQLGMSAKKTMDVAESLYNAGIISYPRTETNKYNFSEAEIRNLVSNQRFSPTWGTYANHLLNGAFRGPRNGTKTDNAHPPIHPLQSGGDNLNQDQHRLLELICRHFLAVVSDDARGHVTKVTINIGNERFHTSGVMISQRNFLDIYTYQRWNNVDIPMYLKDEVFYPNIRMHRGTTTAPQLLTEADLIHLMDKNGIGTDATMAQHIHTIEERTYIRKINNKYIEPLPLGIALVEGYTSMQLDISKPYLRAKMESDMADIMVGKSQKAAILDDNLKLYVNIFERARKTFIKVDEAVASHFEKVGSGSNRLKQKNFSSCGDCSSMMDLRTQTGGIHLLKCSSCKTTKVLPDKYLFEATPHHCPICRFQVLECARVKNKQTKKHFICPSCYNNPPDIEDFNPQKVTSQFRCFQCTHPTCKLSKKLSIEIKKCQLCRHPMYLKSTKSGSYFVGCSNFSKGCKATIWFPKSIKQCDVDVPCRSCGARQVLMKESHQNLPPHPRCLFCDLSLLHNPEFSYKLGSPKPQKRKRPVSTSHRRPPPPPPPRRH